MTTFTRALTHTAVVVAAITVALAGVSAQAPPPQTGGQGQQRPAGRPAGQRAPGGPGGEFNLQSVQNMVDTWALVEAEKDLELTNAQFPDFMARMRRLQTTRRRHMMERQRMVRELNAMVFSSQRPDDAALTEKLKAFDQLTDKSGQEVRQLVQELDGILTPYQRARFRVFEEQMERRKIELLTRARAGRAGGGGTAPAQPPAKGRGGR